MKTPEETIVSLMGVVANIATEINDFGYEDAAREMKFLDYCVAQLKNALAQATAPELTPEERAAQEHERALKQAREDGRKRAIEDTRLWGEKDVLVRIPYDNFDLRAAWREGYEQGRKIPF